MQNSSIRMLYGLQHKNNVFDKHKVIIMVMTLIKKKKVLSKYLSVNCVLNFTLDYSHKYVLRFFKKVRLLGW